MDYEAYRSYHAVNLEARTATASPVELVLVLFDGLMEEMARARAHIDARRLEEKGTSLGRCLDILAGLDSALDTDAGGEVVANLSRLYDYCGRRLNQAGLDLDVVPLDEAMSLIATLRGGWLGVKEQHAAA